jgi:hypothetical protein
MLSSSRDEVSQLWGTLLPRLPYSSPGRCTAREYLDSEDFAGPFPRLFEGAIVFIQRIDHKPPVDVGGGYVYLPAE